MPSRRALLRTGGLGLTAALGGCLFGGDSDDDDEDQTPATTTPNRTTTRLTAEPEPVQELQRVDPVAVPDDATAVLANERVRTLVSDAVTTDGRVDYLPEDGPVDEDDRLVFDAFDRIRFRGETYDPTSSYAGFAQEPSYAYWAEPLEDGIQEGGALVDYAELSDAEREIADRLIAGEQYTVDGHEEKPDAALVFERNEYLGTEDTVYRITVAHGDNVGHHMLSLRAADVGQNSTLVRLQDRALPADLRDPVGTAVETGSAELTDDEAETFREVLGEARFVCTAHAAVEFVPGGAG
ncbi:hypothetical protein [Haloarchaeobius litoreus]|uniref:DUF7979 domain-containing protein n=1 Tax=Haloarchaeobius litoreus TaxID=755306 RepID=A0ABD6DKN2_9EURY|nr:hypothetical protein [Haloarchaeobius litoreus]